MKQTIKNESEMGVALLFTLGILAVLLVLALCFATTSITERKSASNNASLSFARMLADSGVHRAIAALRFYDISSSTAAYDKMYSHEESDVPPNNNRSFDWLWKLETIQKGITYYEWPSTTYDRNKPDAVHWIYVKDDLNDNKIAGRFAYYVTASGGKLDPAASVKHDNADPSGSAAVDETVTPERPGKYSHEISIQNLDQSNSTTYLSATNVTNLSSDAIGASGKLPNGTQWFDFPTMFDATHLNIPVANEEQKIQYLDWFVLNSFRNEDERFWIDGGSGIPANDGNGMQDITGTGEWYHRFNLARTDWDTLTLSNITNAPTAYDPPVVNHDGTGIKWIANFGKDDTGADNVAHKGTFTSLADRRNQIAANILDYCDSDTKATTNDETNPAYTGNDRTPYINEARLHFDGEITETVVGLSSTYSPVVRLVDAYVELCDMYGVINGVTGVTYTANIFLEGSYDWGPPLAGATVNFGSAAVAMATVSITTDGSKSYIVNLNACNISLPTVSPSVTLPSGSIEKFVKNLKITTLKVKLAGPDKYIGADVFADYSYIEPNGTDEGGYDVSTDGLLGNRYVSYQVDGDPRQNLFAADWLAPVNDAIICGTPADKNTGCNPTGGGKDLELSTALDIGTFSISTAFVRNGPMQSPWELGFIHRGEKWETLNLKAYNNDDNDNNTSGERTVSPLLNEYGVSPNIGGRAYSKGDANILDQIKMESATLTLAKVNLRATKMDSLKALLGYIRYGVTLPNADSDKPGSLSNGTELSSVHVLNMANAINGSPDRPFLTRAMVAKAGKLFDFDGAGVIQNTDAKKEEIIGKFINLTKTSIADEFTIICIAQAIRDVGTPGGSGITITKDLNGDGAVIGANFDGTSNDPGYYWNGSAKTFAATLPGHGLVDESIPNCKLGQYDLGADEILSEQKVMVTIRKNSTLKWEIVRYEYVE